MSCCLLLTVIDKGYNNVTKKWANAQMQLDGRANDRMIYIQDRITDDGLAFRMRADLFVL